MSNKTWKEKKLNYLERFFRENAEEWKSAYGERKEFSDRYYMIKEALETLEDEPHDYIKIAFSIKFTKDTHTMEGIQEQFKTGI